MPFKPKRDEESLLISQIKLNEVIKIEKVYKLDLPMLEIKERYLNYESCSQIAKTYGTSKDTISQRLKDMNVKIRKPNDVGYGNSRRVKHKYPKCEVDGCDNPTKSKTKCGHFFCDVHYRMYHTYGDPLHENYYDTRNGVVYKDEEIAILETYNQDGTVSGEFVIDNFNLEKVLKYKWRMDAYGYITRNNRGLGYNFSLHRYLTDFKYEIVDHADKNPKNNKMINLREVTPQENSYNSSIGKNNSSGVIGVHWDKHRNKWKSTIKVNYKNKSKRHDSFDDAIIWRIEKESEYAREFSPNFNPITNTIQLTYLSHDDNEQTFIEVDLDGVLLQFKKLNKGE